MLSITFYPLENLQVEIQAVEESTRIQITIKEKELINYFERGTSNHVNYAN